MFKFNISPSEHIKAGTCVQIGNTMYVNAEQYQQMKDADDITEILSNIKLIQQLPAFELFSMDVFNAQNRC